MHKNQSKIQEPEIEWPQQLNTYLGNKGYTILKSELSIKQQLTLKEMLMVKPYVPGSPVQVQKSFPAYRESDKKLYVPRYFGEELFGPAKTNKITEGEDINLKFNGTLRDYQQPVVEQFINHVKSEDTLGGLLELPCAWGKTSASLNICSQLKKKTLVIVHKEFLMNQWVERIQQFIPEAKIGKIQGQSIDIDGKDIVLCMLQSLVLKEYPSTLFDCFGFTIIDEVHHISSETFSNALFKIVTKYMLGLSATMNRKDGTTKVFKMFLGKVVHKVEKKGGEHNVQIRAVTFKTNDDEFNETILDYKGQPQISSMISKLCTYNRRTEFIIKLLTDFIEVDNVDKNEIQLYKKELDSKVPNCEICGQNNNYLMLNTCCNNIKYCLLCLDNIVEKAKTTKKGNINKTTGEVRLSKERPKCPCCKKVLKYEQNYIENKYVKPLMHCQTIVLSHNLNVLEYIYTKMVCKNLASVGYYVGGMSEPELKNTEKKQVILASYSMASEGLDIPSLNAEFLITPKTDIVQTVGRVLRAKHAYADPIIYDIIDTHDTFQKQWFKRKAYYKKNNYKIIQTNSTVYDQDYSTWKSSYEPIVNKNNKQTVRKTTSNMIKSSSRSSSDRSIADDSDSEEEITEEPKDKLSSGVCLLKFKK
jgi:superfamily II DNA or RNA helicase